MNVAPIYTPPGSVSTADGSALVHTGGTVVLCGVKAVSSYCTIMLSDCSSLQQHHFQELASPTVNSPSQGYIGRYSLFDHHTHMYASLSINCSVQCGTTSLLLPPPLPWPPLPPGTGTLTVPAGHSTQVRRQHVQAHPCMHYCHPAHPHT